MSKILWLDTETTGIDPQKHCLIELAFIVEIDGEVKEEGSILSSPFPGCEIDQEALDVQEKTLDEIRAYPNPKEAYGALLSVLSKYVDRYNINDKFVLAGYFVHFDAGMLRSFFSRNGDQFYGSYFRSVCIDVASWVALETSRYLVLRNYKLASVCQRYQIPIQAHNALSDIWATRELFQKFTAKQ